MLAHVTRTGGTESFTYDGRGLLQSYRDAAHQSGNPTARFQYDALDQITGVTDALAASAGDVNHTINFAYNNRGQVTTTTSATDPLDGLRHTVQEIYNTNGDGTLVSLTDQLNNVVSFTYDDYRRLRSITTPQRSAGDATPRTTYLYYDATGVGEDYAHTYSNVTHETSRGGVKTTVKYDKNYRRTSVHRGRHYARDAATTTFTYDNVGNLLTSRAPRQQPSGAITSASYDERNRQYSISDSTGKVTTIAYDAGGRRKSITRPNGQIISTDNFDALNRPLQQTVKQTPDPDAVTKYTYYASGLLQTLQDPHLVAISSPYTYSYSYDSMGRKTTMTYPPDSSGLQRSEPGTTTSRIA